MGFLSDEFYQNLAKESAARQASSSASIPTAPTESFDPAAVVDRAAASFNPSNFQINTQQFIKTASKNPAATVPGIEPSNKEIFLSGANPMRAAGDLTPEQQAQKFGGPVGSPEYWAYKEAHPISSFLPQQLTTAMSFGAIEFPDLQTWDRMSATDKTLNITAQIGQAPFKLVFGFAKAVVKSIPTLAAAAARPLINAFTGQPNSFRDLAKQESETQSSLIDPIYAPAVEKYDMSLAAGHSPAVATITASLEGGLNIFNNLFASKMFVDVTASLARPPARLVPGETVNNTAPISQSLKTSEAKLQQKASGAQVVDGPAAQYASIDKNLEKQVQQKYGVSGRIFTKVTPAADGTVEISIIEKQGPIQTLVKKIGFGDSNVQNGLLGPEKKLESHIVQVEGAPKEPAAKPIKVFRGGTPIDISQVTDRGISTSLDRNVAEKFKTIYNDHVDNFNRLGIPGAGEKYSLNEYFIDSNAKIATKADIPSEIYNAYKQANPLVKPEIAEPIIGKWAKENGFDAIDYRTLGDTSLKEAEIKVLNPDVLKTKEQIAKNIPDIATKLMPLLDKPLKGFEDTPITRGQVADLSLRAELNGVDPALKDGVVKLLTGKSVVGDLTAAEYLDVSKTLQSLNKVNQFVPGGDTGIYTKALGQYVQPPRGWMDTVQQKTGVPLRDLNLDMENGLRFSNARIQPYMKWAEDIFKGIGPEDRALVDAYRTGNKAAIDANPTLTPEAKTNLKNIAGQVEQFFDVAGEEFLLDTQRWRQGYMPDIMQRGGVFQQYKKGSELPGESNFFAEYERKGGNFTRVNDPLALMQIYTRLGARSKYVSPALERIKELEPEIKTKAADFYDSFKSTIQEKLGYAGAGEKLLDDISARVNKSLNRNLPADLGRQTTQSIMSYAYANVLDSPGTWVRNQITNDVMLYARLGPEFYAKVVVDTNPLTDSGRAIWKEAAERGFLNQANAPYGEELGAATNISKKVTQTMLAPNSFVDNYGRVKAFYLTKLKFEDALSKYNSGKLTWDQAASSMGMDGMSPIESNRVLRQLQAKNVDGAFEELVRSVIDETNFPYRRGEGPRATFGVSGKASTFLYKWQMEYGQTVGRWIRQGNFENLFRYYSASVSYINAFKSMNPGFDFSKTLYGGGPLNAQLPATTQVVLDLIGVVQSQNADNAQAIDDSQEQIIKTLKSFGVPGGVDTANWQAFWRSYSNGPVDGKYAIIGPKGDQTEEPVYFHDLFYRMMGLPTVSKVESAESKRARTNYEYEISQAKRKVAELRNAGKNDEADNLVLKWDAKGEDVEPGPRAYDRFDIPYPERQLDRMTPTGQDIFESGVYK
jgi:hypothetical protein